MPNQMVLAHREVLSARAGERQDRCSKPSLFVTGLFVRKRRRINLDSQRRIDIPDVRHFISQSREVLDGKCGVRKLLQGSA